MKEFPCTYEGCVLSFSCLQDLQLHSKAHTFPSKGAVLCEFSGCGGRFSSRRSLIRHHLFHNIILTPYKCPVKGCDVALSRSENINKHILKDHPDYSNIKERKAPEKEQHIQTTQQQPLSTRSIRKKETTWSGTDTTDTMPSSEEQLIEHANVSKETRCEKREDEKMNDNCITVDKTVRKGKGECSMEELRSKSIVMCNRQSLQLQHKQGNDMQEEACRLASSPSSTRMQPSQAHSSMDSMDNIGCWSNITMTTGKRKELMDIDNDEEPIRLKVVRLGGWLGGDYNMKLLGLAQRDGKDRGSEPGLKAVK